MAPEIMEERSNKGLSVDIWAMEVLLYTLFSGYFPFNANTDEELYETIKIGWFYLDESIPEEVSKLIAGVL